MAVMVSEMNFIAFLTRIIGFRLNYHPLLHRAILTMFLKMYKDGVPN